MVKKTILLYVLLLLFSSCGSLDCEIVNENIVCDEDYEDVMEDNYYDEY